MFRLDQKSHFLKTDRICTWIGWCIQYVTWPEVNFPFPLSSHLCPNPLQGDQSCTLRSPVSDHLVSHDEALRRHLHTLTNLIYSAIQQTPIFSRLSHPCSVSQPCGLKKQHMRKPTVAEKPHPRHSFWPYSQSAIGPSNPLDIRSFGHSAHRSVGLPAIRPLCNSARTLDLRRR